VAVGVADTTGLDAPVHPTGDQLGDHEVAQVMQPTAHPQPAGQALEAWEMPSGSIGLDPSGTWENT
jgi:hypothetical protein